MLLQSLPRALWVMFRWGFYDRGRSAQALIWQSEHGLRILPAEHPKAHPIVQAYGAPMAAECRLK